MRKTKIVCTIGPASENLETLRSLIREGMNVARLNFSHGSHEEHAQRIKAIRQAAKEEGKVVAILLDTKGPEIRTGDLSSPEVELVAGNNVTLTTQSILGDASRVSISYPDFPTDVHPGSTVLIDDGLIGLEVNDIEGSEVHCTIQSSGTLKSKKGVNVPGIRVNLPGITEKDAEDIRFGIEQNVDFIAASFIRKAEDILDIRKILEEQQAYIPIIAKIENQEGVENVDEILKVADGLMVARGDLGVEIPVEEVPQVQKETIRKCNIMGKPVITATQMLDSMQRNPRPTRAETSDVANAILDGTDAIMLSGETAAGKYPVESVMTMAKIAERTEAFFNHPLWLDKMSSEAGHTITESISQAVVHTSKNLKASAIVTATERGYTARMIAKYRPSIPVLAVTPNEDIMRKLNLLWGVFPVFGEECETTDEMFQSSIHAAISSSFVSQGDLILITAGVPVGQSGTTNLMKVYVVGGVLLQGKGIGKQVVTAPVVVGTSPDELREKMVDGAALVTCGTDKEIIDLIQRASVIITEEGGLTSHAAVVCVSLGIPVVVGVRGAVDTLRLEKMITVDTNTGQIYSGKANIM
jgi:pyruvate kinase